MGDRATRLFLRWRDGQQVDALARLFDRTAPRLLRLASHLTSDMAAAEDLLQETFLTAIESADRFDAQRSVTAWLQGILVHRAKGERRRRERAPALGAEADRLSSADSEPVDRAADRELSEAARQAVERLREPFRQPTLLRLLHGMEPAEIALVLDRSPATVRTQICRGLEKARRAVPAGGASTSLVATSAATRGLAAMRSEVVSAATRLTGAKVASGATGVASTGLAAWGFVMNKTGTLLAAAAALCVVALVVLGGMGSGEAPVPESQPSRIPEMAGLEAPSPDSSASAKSESPGVARSAAPTQAASVVAAWTLDVEVIDGPSGEPIPGADLALFGPRSLTLLELQRELAERTQIDGSGVPDDRAESVWIDPELPLEVRLHGARHPFLLPPIDRGAPSLLRRRTDGEGRCELPIPASGVVLEVRADDHVTRSVAFSGDPVTDVRSSIGSGPWTSAEPETPSGSRRRTITLWPEYEIHGVVQTDRCEVVTEKLELLFEGEGGQWSAETDDEGRFSVRVGASEIQVREITCLTPGWTVTRRITKPDGTNGITPWSLSAEEPGMLHVARWDNAQIRVLDEETETPIETIDLQSFDQGGWPLHHGPFHAPGGLFDLCPFRTQEVLAARAAGQDHRPKQLDVTVWADGYAPKTVRGIELFGSELEVREIRLSRGSVPSLRGQVVRGQTPVAGASVELCSFGGTWQSQPRYVLAAAETGSAGRFQIAVPAGGYVCEVFIDGECEAQLAIVVAQEEDEFTIDLADSVFVEVRVVGADGRPRADLNVSVRSGDHQRRGAQTDLQGRCLLGPFEPGAVTASVRRLDDGGSYIGSTQETLEAAPGDRPIIELRLPVASAIRPFLAFEGSSPGVGMEGFQALRPRPQVPEHEPVDVGPDGSVPIDLLPESTFHVTAPNGQRWSLTLPKVALPGHILTLPNGGHSLTGLVTVLGKPLANGRVFACDPSTELPRVSTRTDAEGRFTFSGLEEQEQSLMFSLDGDALHPYGGEISKLRFLCDASWRGEQSSKQIDLVPFRERRFVGIDQVVVTGRLLGKDGKPLVGAPAGGRTSMRRSTGMLELGAVDWQLTKTDGRYRVILARGDRYILSLSRGFSHPMKDYEVAIPAGSAEVSRDFVIE